VARQLSCSKPSELQARGGERSAMQRKNLRSRVFSSTTTFSLISAGVDSSKEEGKRSRLGLLREGMGVGSGKERIIIGKSVWGTRA